MNLETILKAAVNAMITGHHAPHCFSAHVLGKGYVNDGSAAYDRADYLRQLKQSATAEIENMTYAPAFAEKGYTQPRTGVLMANWNVLPDALTDVLEKLGYECVWSDEWSVCDDCNKAVRTQPDCHDWQPSYSPAAMDRGECICHECATDEDEDEQDAFNPDDSNVTTDDHQSFYLDGRLAFEIRETETGLFRLHIPGKRLGNHGYATTNQAIKAALDHLQYWPNVYFISDHGNAHLIAYWND